MYKKTNRAEARVKKRARIRGKVRGTAAMPRLAVYRSLNHVYAQAVDDVNGVTLAAASSREDAGRGNVAGAKKVGATIASRLRENGIEKVVFDRGGFIYHGRVKALADAAREGGLKF